MQHRPGAVWWCRTLCAVLRFQVLPDSLADSIEEAAKATAEAIQRGNNRTQVWRCLWAC